MKALSLSLFGLVAVLLPALGWAWTQGRATFYGFFDGMSIHQGNCGYGYLDKNAGTGWDIAALSDKIGSPKFAGSCGICLEVRCRSSTFTDGYGETIRRESVCRNPEESVVVTVTDACPCYKDTNLYGNRRWCCGDQNHLDLSIWAFEKLAPKGKGVIGIEYRQVPCDYRPEKPAGPPPEGPTPGTGESLDTSPSSNCGGHVDHQCDVRRPVVQAFGFKDATAPRDASDSGKESGESQEGSENPGKGNNAENSDGISGGDGDGREGAGSDASDRANFWENRGEQDPEKTGEYWDFAEGHNAESEHEKTRGGSKNSGDESGGDSENAPDSGSSGSGETGADDGQSEDATSIAGSPSGSNNGSASGSGDGSASDSGMSQSGKTTGYEQAVQAFDGAGSE